MCDESMCECILHDWIVQVITLDQNWGTVLGFIVNVPIQDRAPKPNGR